MRDALIKLSGYLFLLILFSSLFRDFIVGFAIGLILLFVLAVRR